MITNSTVIWWFISIKHDLIIGRDIPETRRRKILIKKLIRQKLLLFFHILNSSVNINLSKMQLHKIGQSGGFLGRILGPLLKNGLPLMKNVLRLLAKSVLIPLELTVAASERDAAINKTMFGSGFTTLIVSNEEMNNMMKIIKSLEESGLFIKEVSEKTKNEAKRTKRRISRNVIKHFRC